jgi:hypothetical protein
MIGTSIIRTARRSTGSRPVTIPMSLSGSPFRKLRKGKASMRY